jgi:hypothetical protein
MAGAHCAGGAGPLGIRPPRIPPWPRLRGFWLPEEPLEQGGELLAFGGGQRREELALLLVEDPHGCRLGAATGLGWVDEKRAPVVRVALPGRISFVL